MYFSEETISEPTSDSRFPFYCNVVKGGGGRDTALHDTHISSLWLIVY